MLNSGEKSIVLLYKTHDRTMNSYNDSYFFVKIINKYCLLTIIGINRCLFKYINILVGILFDLFAFKKEVKLTLMMEFY